MTHSKRTPTRAPRPRKPTLKKSALFLASLVEYASDAIISTDENQQIVLFNQGAEKMFGYRAQDMIGAPVAQLLPARFASTHFKHIQRFAATPEVARTMDSRPSLVAKRKDGSEFPIDVSILKTQDGAETRFTAILRDASAREQQRLALERERAELESRVQTRTAELHQLNQSLRDIERRQSALLNNIPDLAWLKDQDSRFIAVNQPFAQSCGSTPEALVGKSDYDIWPHSLAEQYRADDQAVMRSRQIKRVEEPIAEVTGKSVWIETIKTPVLDDQGVVIGTVGIARDISERKQLDEMRRQSQAELERLVEERTEALAQKNQELENQILERRLIEKDLATQRDFALQVMNAMGQGLTITNAAGHFEFVNPAYAHMLGYEPAELIGKRPQDFTIADDVLVLDQARAARLRGETTTYEHKLKRRDGQLVDALVTGVPRWVDGQVSGTIAVVSNLTERNKMERDLRTSEERYRGMVESQQSAIVRVDAQGRFTYVNDTCCRTFGKTRDELLGHLFMPFVHPDDLAQTLHTMRNLAAPPYRTSVEQRAQTANGWRWIVWEENAIHDANGALIEIQGIGTDITEQKRATESLRVQRDLGLQLGAASNLEEALQSVLAAACQIEGIDSGGVYLFNATGGLDLMAHRGLSDLFVAETRHYASDTPNVRLVQAGKPVYLNYALSSLGNNPAQQIEVLRALAVIPIAHEGIVVAALNLASHTHDQVPEGTRAHVETLAAQVGNSLARLKAQAALRESQRNLQTLFDTLEDFLFILDDAGKILQVNPVVLHRLGYTSDELTGQDVLTLHPPDRRAQAAQIIAAMLAGTSDYCPVPLMGKDGTLIPVETKVTRGSWGERQVLFGISRDVSARQRAEIALRRHTAILEAVNLAAERFLGMADWTTYLPDVLARLGQAAEVSRVYLFENDTVTADEVVCSQRYEWCAPRIAPQIDNPALQNLPLVAAGFARWVESLRSGQRLAGIVSHFPESERAVLEPQGIQALLVVPIHVGGAWWGFIGFDDCETAREWAMSGIDALEAAAHILGAAMRRQQIEESLQQSEARSQAMVNAIPDLMFRLDHQGIILDYKASQTQDLLQDPGSIVGTSVRHIMPPAVTEQTLAKIAATLATGELQTFEYELSLPQGLQTFEARLVVSSAPGIQRQGPEVLAIVRNISERAKLEQMKSDFINRAAHELRTPLTTVILMTELIQDGGTPEELAEYWQVIQRELKRQRVLVEKLLTAGRLEKGNFQMARTPLDLGNALREAQSAILPQAEAKQITVQTEIPPDPLTVNADAANLQQVWVNLLSNAVKFTPPGGTVRLQADAHAGGVRVRVRDTGIGIPPDDLPYMFTRFFRAQNAIHAEVPGSGIGLYIVQGIVETLGGTVHVASELNQGTTFTVWLPLTGANSK